MTAPAYPPEVVRVPTIGRLSDMQYVVTSLVGINLNYRQIAAELSIEPSTAKYHAEEAAKKIPGDLPTQAKLAAWVRGASLDVLEGRNLWYQVVARRRLDQPISRAPGRPPRSRESPLVAVASPEASS